MSYLYSFLHEIIFRLTFFQILNITMNLQILGMQYIAETKDYPSEAQFPWTVEYQ